MTQPSGQSIGLYTDKPLNTEELNINLFQFLHRVYFSLKIKKNMQLSLGDTNHSIIVRL